MHRPHRIELLIAGLTLALFTTLQSAHAQQVPGSACDNWEMKCARRYGSDTPRWYACMDQPRAKFDCQTVEGYVGAPPQETSLCQNWRQGCARLHGARSRNSRLCMRQPQALVDCGRF
jgi:hypothetical protein